MGGGGVVRGGVDGREQQEEPHHNRVLHARICMCFYVCMSVLTHEVSTDGMQCSCVFNVM